MAPVRSNRVCFTWNNYDEYGLEQLELWLKQQHDNGGLQYAIMGREIGAMGTPHIQGFIHLKKEHYTPKSCGVTFWRMHVPSGLHMHFETARGSDEQQYVYCTKEGPFWEVGEMGGNTNQWNTVVELCRAGDVETLQKDHAEIYVKNHFQILKIIKGFQMETRLNMKLEILRDWQNEVIKKMDAQNNRQILFVVDEEGGKGKSALCSHLMSTRNVWACQGGKIADLMHSYKRSAELALFDMARCNTPDYYPWNFMENLKSGWFCATKYDSGLVAFTPPKVVVFMNHDPPRNKLSSDRWQIYNI